MMDPSTSKLPKRLNSEPDRKIIKNFRKWEQLERKIAAFRNHLHFTLHCKHHDVVPPSLKLKCAMRGRNADTILQRAQRALINERVNEIKRKLEEFEKQRAEADEFLFTTINHEYDEIKRWMAHAQEVSFESIRQRQQKKFTRLYNKKTEADREKNGPIVEVDTKDIEAIQSKWVVNLSDKTLTADEENVLKHGLNFAVTPKEIPVDEYIIGIETACRAIGPQSKEAETLRAHCVRVLKNAPLLGQT